MQNHKKWEYVVWLAPSARNRSTTTRASPGGYIVYRKQMIILSKTNDICATVCYQSESPTTTIILKKNKVQQSLRIMATLRFGAICSGQRKEIPPPIVWGEAFRNYIISRTQLSRLITLTLHFVEYRLCRQH